MSETNSGVFPFARIYDVIDGRFELATHGTRDMPVWGEIYKRSWAQEQQNGTLPYLASKEVVELIVRVRGILALIDYIFTLQEGRCCTQLVPLPARGLGNMDVIEAIYHRRRCASTPANRSIGKP